MAKKLTKEELAQMIDHTNLHADITLEAVEKLCAEARDNHFKMVAINPAQVVLCKKLLKDTDVHVGAAIGFPLGQETLETKAFSTKDAIKNGADEIDYVINIHELKQKNYEYLTKEEIKKMAEIALEVKPDFIKTSTGFGTSGAKVEDVELMKSVVGDEIGVKAAGGIRSLKEAQDMINAGATRIGTSKGVEIIQEMK